MLSLERVEFALDDILETVSAVTTLRAEEKGIEVVYSIAPEVPRHLRGDPLRLSQVLNNLVSNAQKFTEKVLAAADVPRSEVETRALARILAESGRLERLVTQLLALERVEARASVSALAPLPVAKPAPSPSRRG
mgnify:CR=1 FL=1